MSLCSYLYCFPGTYLRHIYTFLNMAVFFLLSIWNYALHCSLCAIVIIYLLSSTRQYLLQLNPKHCRKKSKKKILEKKVLKKDHKLQNVRKFLKMNKKYT